MLILLAQNAAEEKITFSLVGALDASAGVDNLILSGTLPELQAGISLGALGADWASNTPTLECTGVLSAIPTDIIPVPAFTADLKLSLDSAGFFSIAGAVVRYIFTITGAADGTTDIEIPISSFQCRMRSGDPTYLSVVIPTVDYASEITARANGTLKVDMAYKNDGSYLQRETIIQADLENVALDEGGINQSITLTGHKTETFSGKAITLEKSTYRSVKDGKVRHRLAKPNIYLRPGDTVTVDSDTFIADTVSYAISVDSKTMEVAEA